jgi:mannose-6-phosphate isomerase-like protein (cupin superfamily)
MVEYWLDADEVEPAVAAGVETRVLFGGDRGCSVFEQRLLSFSGETSQRRDDDRDEVLYVLDGSGSATIGGERHELTAGTGVFVARGTTWRVDSVQDLRLLSVLVEEPLPATAGHSVVAPGERGTATAGREFTLLAGPEQGCASVTQFVGHIPPGRAPDHFHRYDEVVHVLGGEGALHIGGETAPLRSGACVHLPARLVHCLENFGPGEMHVLGVFRPAGSPAEAYYPDGAAAAVPTAGDES